MIRIQASERVRERWAHVKRFELLAIQSDDASCYVSVGWHAFDCVLYAVCVCVYVYMRLY